MDKHSEDVKPALDQIAKMQKMDKNELSENEKQKEVETLKEGIKKAKPFYDRVGGHPVSDEDKKLLEENIKKIYSCPDDQIIKFKTLVVSEYMNQYCDGTKALNFVYLSSAMANMPKSAKK